MEPDNRHLGTGLTRSGDQGMLLRGIVSGIAWLVLAVVRGLGRLARALRGRP